MVFEIFWVLNELFINNVPASLDRSLALAARILAMRGQD